MSGKAANPDAGTTAIAAKLKFCFVSSVPGIKLTIIGQQSNFTAEIDGSSLCAFGDLSQCCTFFARGQCSPLAGRTTLLQYATQTAPPAFMHTKVNRNAAMNFAWKGFGVIEASTLKSYYFVHPKR
jgi:hypothetical protein